MTDKFATKVAQKFICLPCDYICYRQNDYNKHILTAKHKNTDTILTNTDAFATNVAQNGPSNIHIFTCECGKEYKHRQSLFTHRKKCKPTENDTPDELTNLVKYLMKENNEFKNMMLEQSNTMLKVIENGTHNTTNHNSHNKSFNLNFFLNETCKDAMNIMDFVDSIKLQLSDLERVGEVGYIEGISTIIVKNLKNLDVTLRPVHCTDKKRETIYIKDEDKWAKDDNKTTMHKVVKKVTTKNQKMIQQFKEAHPDYGKYSSKFSDQYNKIIVESMGGHGDNDFEKEEKIIAKVSKEITIEKEPFI